MALDDEEDEDDDVFGDFEDLETGEKHDVTEQKNGSDGKSSFIILLYRNILFQNIFFNFKKIDLHVNSLNIGRFIVMSY